MELQEIRDSVRQFAVNEIPRYQNEEYFHTIPSGLWKGLAQQGLCGIGIPEEYEGLPLDAVAIMSVLEELAAVDLGPAVFLSVHAMVAGLIYRHGSEEQKKKYLPKMAAGEILGAFALTEPSAGSDAVRMKSTAKKSGASYILNGEKCYITSAGFADLYIVFARTKVEGNPKDGITAFLLERDVDGFSISPPEQKMGCELSPIASLYFSDVKLSAEHIIGNEHQGYKVALSGLSGGRINIAACANGIARAALEKARSHLLEREQFGQKLAEFQGLQFMFADMTMQYEAAKLLTEKAAIELKEKGSSRISSSIAKCFATDAAMKITTDAVQLLGGAGYIFHYGVEKLMRDAKMLQIVEGTNQIQRMLIAREILG